MDRRRFLRIGYRLRSNIIGVNGADNCAQKLFRTIRCVAADIQEIANEKMSEKPNVRCLKRSGCDKPFLWLKNSELLVSSAFPSCAQKPLLYLLDIDLLVFPKEQEAVGAFLAF